jgi:mannitol-1-/sugar-/sorbitol-6-phosphatase
MTQISCNAMLFDLDGVLIDSTHVVTRVWREWAQEHGFDPEEVVHQAHGRPSLSTVRHFLPNADHEQENREVERREMADVEGIVVWPGTRELLAALPADRWTIVTSCTRALAEVRLRAAGLLIPPRLVTSNDVKNGKPDPEPYIKGATVLGFRPQDCVVVEDVPAGIRAGKASGARVIAFQTTLPDSELRKASPDWIVKDCSAISLAPPSDGKQGLTLELKTN